MSMCLVSTPKTCVKLIDKLMIFYKWFGDRFYLQYLLKYDVKILIVQLRVHYKSTTPIVNIMVEMQSRYNWPTSTANHLPHSCCACAMWSFSHESKPANHYRASVFYKSKQSSSNSGNYPRLNEWSGRKWSLMEAEVILIFITPKHHPLRASRRTAAPGGTDSMGSGFRMKCMDLLRLMPTLPLEWIGWQLLKASVVIQNTQRNNGNPQQGTRGVCVLDTEQTLPDRAGGKLSPSALATPSGKSDKCGCLTKNVTYFNYTNHLLTQQDGRGAISATLWL